MERVLPVFLGLLVSNNKMRLTDNSSYETGQMSLQYGYRKY